MSEQEPRRKAKIANARAFRKSRTYLLQIRPDAWFRMRRVDMTTLLFEGIVPTPLLSAVDRMADLRRAAASDGTLSIEDAMGKLTKEDFDGFQELLRRAAVACVAEPQLTHSKRRSIENPDLLWVGGFSDVPGEENRPPERGDVETAELLTVWQAITGEAGIITMSDADADEFRSDESHVDDPVVQHGDDVRPKTVDVVPGPDPSTSYRLESDPAATVYETPDRIIVTH